MRQNKTIKNSMQYFHPVLESFCSLKKARRSFYKALCRLNYRRKADRRVVYVCNDRTYIHILVFLGGCLCMLSTWKIVRIHFVYHFRSF